MPPHFVGSRGSAVTTRNESTWTVLGGRTPGGPIVRVCKDSVGPGMDDTLVLAVGAISEYGLPMHPKHGGGRGRTSD